MMDQTVHVYIHHLRFLWYTFFFALDLWPLARKLHSLTHSLTYSHCLTCVVPLLPVFQFIHLFSCLVAANSQYKIKGTLRREYLLMIHDWLASHITLFLCQEKQKHSTESIFFPLPLSVVCFATAPCCIHLGSPSHIGGTGACLSVLLIFPLVLLLIW